MASALSTNLTRSTDPYNLLGVWTCGRTDLLCLRTAAAQTNICEFLADCLWNTAHCSSPACKQHANPPTGCCGSCEKAPSTKGRFLVADFKFLSELHQRLECKNAWPCPGATGCHPCALMSAHAADASSKQQSKPRGPLETMNFSFAPSTCPCAELSADLGQEDLPAI